MKSVLLNLSEFNNNWNKSLLDMSWNERLAARGVVASQRTNRRGDSQVPDSQRAQAAPNNKDHSTPEASGR